MVVKSLAKHLPKGGRTYSSRAASHSATHTAACPIHQALKLIHLSRKSISVPHLEIAVTCRRWGAFHLGDSQPLGRSDVAEERRLILDRYLRFDDQDVAGQLNEAMINRTIGAKPCKIS